MSDAFVLHVRGLGHVPSFKNNKRIFGKNLVTRPDVAKWMERAIQDLQSQLRSLSRTNAIVTSMGISAQSLTALLEHSTDFDDSHQWLPNITVEVKQVEKGDEGADILITLL